MGQIVSGYKSGKVIKDSFDVYMQSHEEGESEGKALPYMDGIEVKNLNFSYENVVFENFSQTFQMHKKYAIVGPVGCGKSTLLKIIGGILESEAVFYSGVGQKDLAKESLYSHMAFVDQSPYFFEESLYENLTLYRDFPLTEVEKAIDRVGLKEKIAQLPEGLDTLLTENAQILSGGERQKMALARALLSDKPILLLDEYTSSMDAKSSLLVQKMIMDLNKTVIFITHKVGDYDVLHADEVVELGK